MVSSFMRNFAPEIIKGRNSGQLYIYHGFSDNSISTSGSSMNEKVVFN
jgi:hypothetical protein